MVFPIVPIIMAAGALGSAYLGSKASKDAQKSNERIARQNAAATERERISQLFQAIRNQADQRLGTTDAYGVRTYFQPGKGVVTDVPPEIQQLIDSSLQEQFLQQTEDAGLAREARRGVTERGLEAGQTADSVMQRYLRETPGREADIFNRYDTDTSRTINEGYDSAQNAAMLQAFRQGLSGDNIGRAIERSGDARGEALQSSRAQNRAFAAADKSAIPEQQQLGSLYNQFVANAAGVPLQGPGPSGAGADANSLLALFANRSAAGDAQRFAAAGRPGARYDYVQPDFSNAALFGGVAEAISPLAQAFLGTGGGLDVTPPKGSVGTQYGTTRSYDVRYPDQPFFGNYSGAFL